MLRSKWLWIGMVVVVVIGGAFLFGGRFVEGDSAGPPPLGSGPMMALEPMTTNLADASGSRLIKTTIAIEFSGEPGIEEANRKQPVVRNALLEVLRDQTSGSIAGRGGQRELAAQLRSRVNQLLETDARKIYFEELIVQ